MTSATRQRLANAFTILAVVLLLVQLYGMLQTPRPAWTTGALVPALVPALALLIVARGVRRRARREP